MKPAFVLRTLFGLKLDKLCDLSVLYEICNVKCMIYANTRRKVD